MPIYNRYLYTYIVHEIGHFNSTRMIFKVDISGHNYKFDHATIFHLKSIDEWIDNLYVFKDTLADFNKTNIEEFFKSVYETQCHENLSALEVNIL